MKLSINRKSSRGLTRQIADQLRDLIRKGELRPDEKLPSTRLLSKDLEVNRITVSQAYKQLIAEGLIRSGVGSGTFVSYQSMAADPVQQDKMDRSNYAHRFSSGVQALWREEQEAPQMGSSSEDAIHFATLVPDEKFFPVQAFRDCLDEVMSREGSRLLQYCGTSGYPPLREYIAERMRNEGLPASSEEILMVNGAQQGIDLMLRCFLSPGDKIAISIPTYHNIFPLIGLLGASAAPVRMTDQGPDLDSLEAAARDPAVRLFYSMPNFHNPTGVTCSLAQRKGIAEIAAAYDLPILEDDFEKDLAFQEESLPPIKALDPEGRVTYLSTFSKSLFPGLRIGWLMASGETLKALLMLKKATDLENSALLQAAAFEFCRQGCYDEHLKKIRVLIRERMGTAFEALTRHMPEGVTWSRPKGGYVLWIRLPEGISSKRIYERGREEGIVVSPGTLFTYQGSDPGGIRLSLTKTDVEEIRRGIEKLGRIIAGELKSLKSPGPAAEEPSQLL
ncbi:MAG: MocR-like pyridoxine biosynthesis transcription factor PdxR [Planctomycetota bacterium]|jgi:GntR family transcriptional regulator/MocR family aminotransferase